MYAEIDVEVLAMVIGSDDESGDLLLKNLESPSRSRLLPVSATGLLTNNTFAPTLLMR